MKGFRWVETGDDVWGLEDELRHFRGYVSVIADDTYSWSASGGPSYSTYRTSDSRTEFVMCGECATRREAKAAVERIVFAIHRYCRATSFGTHEYALFEFEDGKPVVRAVGSGIHCFYYLKPGGLIVAVSRYRRAS